MKLVPKPPTELKSARRVKPSKFSMTAIRSFEETYNALFEQSTIEVERLGKVNRAMAILEETLLDPERLQELEVAQQVALVQMLSRTSNDTIKNLMGFGQMFLNIRNVVGLLDGIQKHTGLSSVPPAAFPGYDGEVDDVGAE